MDVVRERLLTPVGLRTLAPGHPDYKDKYFGDIRARDAAYHQGTVWPWLIGPFIDAWLRLHPEDKAGARGFLEGLVDQLNEKCVGSINEVFDAEEPYSPRGCVAQAWSVAEMLRCWLKTESMDGGEAVGGVGAGKMIFRVVHRFPRLHRNVRLAGMRQKNAVQSVNDSAEMSGHLCM